MIFAIIEGNEVINKIEASKEFVDANYPGAIDLTTIEPHPNFGDLWDGKKFTPKLKEPATVEE